MTTAPILPAMVALPRRVVALSALCLLWLRCGSSADVESPRPDSGPVACPTRCGRGELTELQTLRHRDHGLTGLAGPLAMVRVPGAQGVIVAASRSGRLSTVEWAPPQPRLALGDAALDVPSRPSALVVTGSDATTQSLLVGTLDGPDLVAVTRDAATGAMHATDAISGPFFDVRDLVVTATGAVVVAAASAVSTVGRTSEGWRAAPTQDAATASLRGTRALELDARSDIVWACGYDGDGLARLAVGPTGLAVTGAWTAKTSGMAGLAGIRDLVGLGSHLYGATAGGVVGLDAALQGEVTPLALWAAPLPDGVGEAWDGSSVLPIEAIAASPDGTRVFGATYFGAYVYVWDRVATTGALANPRRIPFQAPVTDDDFEEAGDGVVLGRDPRLEPRPTSLLFDAQSGRLWLSSAVWDLVASVDVTLSDVTLSDVTVSGAAHATAQEGDGGVMNLGGAYAVTVSPDDKHVYVASWNIPEPAGFVRGPPAGSDRPLLPIGPVTKTVPRAATSGFSGIVVTSDGLQVLAVDPGFPGEDSLFVYDREPESGQLAFRGSVDPPGSHDIAVAVACSNDGRSVYTAAFESSSVAIYTRTLSTGEVYGLRALTHGQGGITGLDGVEDVVVSTDDRHVYAASYRSAAVVTFDRDAASGDLTPRQVLRERSRGQDVFHGLHFVVPTPDGRRLVAGGPVTHRLIVLDRADDGSLSTAFVLDYDTTTAAAWGRHGRGAGPEPGRVAISPDSRSVYAALRGWDTVAVWRLEDDGRLTFVGSYPLPTTTVAPIAWPNGVAVTADGHAVLVASRLGDALTVLSRAGRGAGEADGCGGLCPAP